MKSKAIRCCNCGREFASEEEGLVDLVEFIEGTAEVEYYQGCPECKTDKYLLDL